MSEYRKLRDKKKFTKYHHISELFDDDETFIGNYLEIVFI